VGQIDKQEELPRGNAMLALDQDGSGAWPQTQAIARSA
jgi:hypothetical protein